MLDNLYDIVDLVDQAGIDPESLVIDKVTENGADTYYIGVASQIEGKSPKVLAIVYPPDIGEEFPYDTGAVAESMQSVFSALPDAVSMLASAMDILSKERLEKDSNKYIIKQALRTTLKMVEGNKRKLLEQVWNPVLDAMDIRLDTMADLLPSPPQSLLPDPDQTGQDKEGG